jgi:hypothetical protein
MKEIELTRVFYGQIVVPAAREQDAEPWASMARVMDFSASGEADLSFRIRSHGRT